jgi:hypothetical protein
MTWNRGNKRLLLVILAILPPAMLILGMPILYTYTWDWEFVLDLLFMWLLFLLLIWGGVSLIRWWIARYRDGYLY